MLPWPPVVRSQWAPLNLGHPCYLAIKHGLRGVIDDPAAFRVQCSSLVSDTNLDLSRDCACVCDNDMLFTAKW